MYSINCQLMISQIVVMVMPNRSKKRETRHMGDWLDVYRGKESAYAQLNWVNNLEWQIIAYVIRLVLTQ